MDAEETEEDESDEQAEKPQEKEMNMNSQEKTVDTTPPVEYEEKQKAEAKDATKSQLPQDYILQYDTIPSQITRLTSEYITGYMYIIFDDDKQTWKLSRSLPSHLTPVGVGDALYFQNIQVCNLPGGISRNVPVKIESLKSKLDSLLPFKIGRLDASQSLGDVDDSHFMLSNVENKCNTWGCSYYQVKPKSPDNHSISVTELAIRIDVGVQSAIDWISEQFDIVQPNIKSDLDSDVRDKILNCFGQSDNIQGRFMLLTLNNELVRKYMVCTVMNVL